MNALNFADYITQCQHLIEKQRFFKKHLSSVEIKQILFANSPFELYPRTNKLKIGALLIHGLLDSPFTMRDIAQQLQQQGILTRAILLPGHGTIPADLLTASHEKWYETVRYGIQTLKAEVEQVFVMGFSTGGALALKAALEDAEIAGVIQLCPVFRIRAFVDWIINWRYLTNFFMHDPEWIEKNNEINPAKYQSLPYHAVSEVTALTRSLREIDGFYDLKSPLLMILSAQDETISSRAAIHYFKHLKGHQHQLLLYSEKNHSPKDQRIHVRAASYPGLHIKNFSHVSIPFSPNNPYYGIDGGYIDATKPAQKGVIYGAYNRLHEEYLDKLYHLGLIKHKRRELTFNPDFENMSHQICEFILANATRKEIK